MRDGVVVVTGAAGGMGLATAARYAASHPLLLCDVSQQALEAVQASLPGKGHRTLALDLATPGSAVLVGEQASRMGTLAGLVHTAGLSPTMGDARRIIDVNLLATVRLLDVLGRLAGVGTVGVLVASIAGHGPVDGHLFRDLLDPLAPGAIDRLAYGRDSMAGYALSKAGVIRLTEARAAAWGARGARLCSVSPGLISTPMGAQEAKAQPVMNGLVQATPLGRWGLAEEIADAIEFLTSDRASFISGTDLRVDGGLVPVTRAMAQAAA